MIYSNSFPSPRFITFNVNNIKAKNNTGIIKAINNCNDTGKDALNDLIIGDKALAAKNINTIKINKAKRFRRKTWPFRSLIFIIYFLINAATIDKTPIAINTAINPTIILPTGLLI